LVEVHHIHPLLRNLVDVIEDIDLILSGIDILALHLLGLCKLVSPQISTNLAGPQEDARPSRETSVTIENRSKNFGNQFRNLGSFLLDVILGDVFDILELRATDLTGVNGKGLDFGVNQFPLEAPDKSDQSGF
jgi:hypothetical protein